MTIRVIRAIIWRDLILGWRHAGDVVSSLGLFAMIITMVPLALGPNPTSLAVIAPAVLWIAALLATLPQIERQFARDSAEGGIDHLLMTPAPLPLVMLAKALAPWMTIATPLVLASPLMGIMLGIQIKAMGVVMLALMLGSFGLTLLGVLTATLVIGSRRASVLMAIIALPLAMPILIFGTAASAAAMANLSPIPALKLLLATVLVMLVVAPPVAAISLKHSAE